MIRISALPVLKRFGLFLFAAMLFACNHRRSIIHINTAFSKYIEAFTSGVISRKNTIRLQLSSEVNTVHSINEELDEALFSFSPSLPGKAYWVDNRTIEFKPEKELKADELYEVSFRLNKIAAVPKEFNTFRFNVQTPKPSFLVTQNGLYATGKETMLLKGQVTTADVEESRNIESILSASLDAENLDIQWQHNEGNKIHEFVIENIKRKTKDASLRLQWNGASLHADSKDELRKVQGK